MRNGVVEVGGKVYPFSSQNLGEQPVSAGTNPWTATRKEKPDYNRQITILPFTGRKDIDEVPCIVLEKMILHEINDAYAVTGVHPDTLASYQSCGKISGVWRAGVLYIDIASVEAFYRRIGKGLSFFRLRLTFIHLLIYFN